MCVTHQWTLDGFLQYIKSTEKRRSCLPETDTT